jgi:leucyl aminopeptidase
LGLSTVVVALPEGAGEAGGRASAEGTHLANYRFTLYSDEKAKKERRHPLRRVTLAGQGINTRAITAGLRLGTIEAEATILARDLVNTPSADMTPRTLADKAREIARTNRAVTVTVRSGDEIEKRLKMGAFAAVGRGAENPPQFIHLTYTKRPSLRRVVLIGKGLTFDSGGYSIKTAEGMETMKIDMAGAAAVLGVFSALPEWKPAVDPVRGGASNGVEVHGLIAACENLISGRAMKPGDIVRAKNGKTILVENTDAEGRLTLADALSYAVELKPDTVIDLATLTGACITALGHDIAGMFSNDEGLAERLRAAAAESGEPVWRMPLPAD